MGRRRAYLHVGLDDGSGDVVGEALGRHAHALLDLRVRRPGDQGATFRGVLDVLEAHTAFGYDRDEVDGAWDDLVRRARPGRDTIVLSHSLLASADAAHARAVVSSFDGFDVHAVVTARAPDAWVRPGEPGRDLTEVLPCWADAVGAPERVHVLLGDPVVTWKALGRVADFGTASLKVPPAAPSATPTDPALAAAWLALLGRSSYDVVGDCSLLEPAALAASDPLTAAGEELAATRRELERLRHRNDELELRLAKVERKRRKLKRRLSEIS